MAQSLQIDGLAILDVIDAREELDALGYPAPDQLARANSILNPLGSAPCRAWLLLSYASLSSLSKESTAHQITWQDHAGNVLNFYQLVFVKGRCLTPGKPSDPTAIYLCEFADRQWLADNPVFNVPISLQYNVAAADAGAGVCYYDTTNAGVNWTWATMWANLWAATVGGILGTAPALPWTPNGTPWNFIFPGLSGWRAIDQFLTRIGCALDLNPLLATNQISVVQVGAADAVAAALLAQSEPRKLHDEFFVESQIGKIPSGVVVYFHRQNSDYGTENTTGFATGKQWQTSGVYSISIAGPAGVGASGAYHPIWDDLPALYTDAGTTPSNATALTARAQERANDYYRWIQSPGGDFQHRTYSGLIPFSTGATIRGVAWRQDGNGLLVTEVVRHPFGRLIITETGQWEEEDWDSSTALQPPDFRPSFPNYPHLLQVVKLTSGTASGGLFPAVVEQFSSSGLSYADEETCSAWDVNGATTLPVGRYLARLSGFNGSTPVYQINSASGTSFIGNITVPSGNTLEVQSGGALTIIAGATVTYDDSPTFNGTVSFSSSSEALFAGLVVLNGTTQTTAGAIWILASGCLLQWYCGSAVHTAVRVEDKNVANGVAGLGAGAVIAAAQVALAAKGDMPVCDGAGGVQKIAAGADNTVLIASSAAANGVAYVALVSSKGDLPAYTGSAITPLAVGADGDVLTADSTQGTGLKWAPPATPSGVPTQTTSSGLQTGTTTASYVTIVNVSAPTGSFLRGLFTIENTPPGSNGLNYRVTATDVFGNTETVTSTVATGPGNTLNFLVENVPFFSEGLRGGLTNFQFAVEDESSGNHATFSYAYAFIG